MANEAYDEAFEGKKSYEKLLTQKQVNVDLYYRLGLKEDRNEAQQKQHS